MERKKANYAVKRQARYLYEVEGMSLTAVGKEVGFTSATIGNWKKAEEWAPKGSLSAGGPSVTVAMPEALVEDLKKDLEDDQFAPTPEPAHVESSDAELRARVAELEAENAELEKRVDEFRPDVDITMMMFESEKDLEVIYDEQHWRDKAQAEFTGMNKQRRLEGLEILKYTEDELVDVIRRLKQAELVSRKKTAWGPPDKRIKMVKPHLDPTTGEKSYFPPHIVQLPYESQVNNVAGSLADGIIRYTRKGFKMTSPFLCPRRNCFRPAAIKATDLEWAFDGYCSQEHYVDVEKPKDRGAVTSVTTKDLVGGLSAR